MGNAKCVQGSEAVKTVGEMLGYNFRYADSKFSTVRTEPDGFKVLTYDKSGYETSYYVHNTGFMGMQFENWKETFNYLETSGKFSKRAFQNARDYIQRVENNICEPDLVQEPDRKPDQAPAKNNNRR